MLTFGDDVQGFGYGRFGGLDGVEWCPQDPVLTEWVEEPGLPAIECTD